VRGSRTGCAGRADVAGDVLGDQPVAGGEAVQPADGGQGAGGRGHGQLRFTERDHERGDVGGAHLGQVAVAEVLDVALQIGGVERSVLAALPPLDGEVVQEGLDRLGHLHATATPPTSSTSSARSGPSGTGGRHRPA
jgi:hypothetical protein